MIKITKTSEPKEWIEHRTTPGTTYEAIPELRQSLLKEQGSLCAYCMRRIPLGKREDGAYTKIDHHNPRANNQGDKMDYANMVLCCPGLLDAEPHCDKKKQNHLHKSIR